MLERIVIFMSVLLFASMSRAETPTTQPRLATRIFHTRADGKQFAVQSCELSADGSKFAIMLADIESKYFVMTIYDVESGRALYESKGSNPGVFGIMAFSPDSSNAAVMRENGEDSGTIEVVELSSGRTIYKADAAPFNSDALFTNDGHRLLFKMKLPGEIADPDKSVYAVVDLETSKVVMELNLNDRLCDISANGEWMLTTKLKIWNLKSGEQISALQAERKYAPLAARFLPDGMSIRTVDENLSVRTWDTRSGKLIDKIDPPQVILRPGPQLGLSRDGTLYYFAGADDVYVFDALTNKPLGSWRAGPTNDSIINDAVGVTECGAVVVDVHIQAEGDYAVVQMPPLNQLTPIPLKDATPATKPELSQ